MLFWINARPRRSGVDSPIHTAADFASLISVAGEDFIAVARVDQDARKVTERKITSPATPVRPAVMRHVERLLRSHVYIVRPPQILNDRIHRSFRRNIGYLLPGLPTITRNQNARSSSTCKNRFRMLRIHRNTTGPGIEVGAVRQFLPTLCWIEAAVKAKVG